MSAPGATPAGYNLQGLDALSTPCDLYPRFATEFPGSIRARLLSVLPLVAIITILLYGCAPLEPQRPPEVRTQVVEVKVPVPVPCFTEADRPVLAPLTPIDIDRATPSQKAAAQAADDINETLYRNAVDALFLRCVAATGGLK